MAKEALKTLIQQGPAALKAGGEVAARATDEIQNDARNPQLKAALDQGNEKSKQWQERIERALWEADGGDGQHPPILEAHYEVRRRIRQQAPDDFSQDLGIIAAGQLALH
ncbi:hypothetical protein [Hymenobacter terrenus]|uniref:hypothetical protein n=1 Tax=Hymenobacter terrenus TaxID=1629124 RepID=UPI00061A06AF|nr:hypothetical protein [Hymenobacter terrenus]